MYYFAYGINLNRKQMAGRCPGARTFAKATLPNFKLMFSGWSRQWRGGTATIKPVKDERVVGGLYEVSDKDMKTIDALEGYPNSYNRISVTVFTDYDEPVKAITYIKAEQSEDTKPSADYLSIIQQGYKDWGLV